MAETTYSYSITSDFPDGKVNPTTLKSEIENSSIVTALARIDTDGGTFSEGVITGGSIEIVFKDALSTGDKTTLDNDTTNPAGGLIAAHDNSTSINNTVALPATQAGVLEEGGVGSRPIVGGGRRSGYIATSATSTAVIRATSYFHQSSAAQRSLKSLSADDTATGTGARKVKITYFDGSMNGPKTEIVTMNGTTAVATTATDIRFVDKLEVVEIGSGGTIPAGTIQMFDDNAGAGGLITSIAGGDGRTYHAHHFIAADRICFITEVQIAAKSINGVMTLNAQDPLNANQPQVNLDISYPYDDVIRSVSFASPIPVLGPSLTWLNTKPDAATSSITYGAFGFFEVLK